MASSSLSTPPCVVGRNISIRGSLVGEEDLAVEGRVEGNITLSGHLVVAADGVVEANIDIESVEVHGEVIGDIVASRSITIEKGASVQGNVRAPRVIVHDGAQFSGSVEMEFDLPEALAKTYTR